MPTISTFHGLKISLYYNDHNPPHFHVAYAGHQARVVIADGSVLDNSGIPVSRMKLVEKWRNPTPQSRDGTEHRT